MLEPEDVPEYDEIVAWCLVHGQRDAHELDRRLWSEHVVRAIDRDPATFSDRIRHLLRARGETVANRLRSIRKQALWWADPITGAPTIGAQQILYLVDGLLLEVLHVPRRTLDCGCCTAGCVCWTHRAPLHGVRMYLCDYHRIRRDLASEVRPPETPKGAI